MPSSAECQCRTEERSARPGAARRWQGGRDHLGIDQGPILTMMENHRSGLVWRTMRKHPHIRGVWMDYLCVPQGQKDAQELDFFQFTLDNIKMLYLSGQVLIFLDIQYMGRFWTQYEAFLALHSGTPRGIMPKTPKEVDDSVIIIEMGAAAAAAPPA